MLRIAAAVAVLTLALPAHPAEPGSAAGSSGAQRSASAHAGASAQRAARTLVSEGHWSELLDGYADSLSRRMQAALKSQGSAAPGALQANVRRELGTAFPYARMIEVHAAELERHFSAAELDTISRFYEGPTGQKLLHELPAVGEAVNGSFRERLADVIPGIVKRNAPSLSAQQGTGSGPDGSAR